MGKGETNLLSGRTELVTDAVVVEGTVGLVKSLEIVAERSVVARNRLPRQFGLNETVKARGKNAPKTSASVRGSGLEIGRDTVEESSVVEKECELSRRAAKKSRKKR